MGLESESTAEKTGFSKVRPWFIRNAKLLVVCFAVGMICHAQMYLNGLSNPDAVVSLSNPMDTEALFRMLGILAWGVGACCLLPALSLGYARLFLPPQSPLPCLRWALLR